MPNSDLPPWKQMIAGGTTGFVSCLIGFPLDLLKTALQAQKLDVRSLMRERVLNIWRGSLFPLVVSTGSGAVYFMILEQTRSFIRQRTGVEQLTMRLEFLAGTFSGFVSGIMSAFSEVVKINLQVDRTKYVNSLDFVKSQWSAQMIPVYLRSFLLCTSMGAICSGIFFSLYFQIYNNLFKDSWLAGFYSGALAGFATWNAVFLLDTLKTLIIASGKNFSWRGVLLRMRGLSSRDFAAIYSLGVVRGIVADSFSLLSYDTVTKLLKKKKL